MIGFRDSETESVFQGRFSKKLPDDIQQRARRRLIQLHSSSSINDLRIPPSNRLVRFRGDRAEEWSIRVNRQWRIVFHWEDGNAADVAIEDYH
ncbi:MAG: type II toxin-antitoxin system RelE/ParE family toxin [Verrucomicrobiota bacterium]